MNFLIYNIPCIICSAIAGLGLYLNREGWGWFLFAAILLAIVPSGSSSSEEKDD